MKAPALSGVPAPSGQKSKDSPLRPLELLTVALAMALLAAFSQLALLAYWKFRSGYVLRFGPDMVWMTPVAVVAVYAVPVLLLFFVSRFWPRLSSLPVVVGLLALLATIDLSLMERRLTLWAVGLLALGVGVQAGRMAEKHRAGFIRMARAAALGLVLLVVLATVAVSIGRGVGERRAQAAMPPALAGAPNVLMIILDTVRAQSLGLYGYIRDTTPVLDSLAANATVFEQAFVPGTWSVPSHASMFTGRWPHELTSWRQPPRRSPHPPLAEVLAEAGYRTGGFVANWWSLGWESGLAQGFQHYEDLGRSIGQIARGSATVRWLGSQRGFRRSIGLYDSLGRRRAPEITRSLLRWLDERSERPYFAFVNYLDAHSPYLPPAPFDQRFGVNVSEREPIVMEELNRRDDPGPEAAAIELAAYDGSIAYLDDQLRHLFRELDATGALANTIVIITSDHGEQLGENGAWGHAASLKTQIVHVPLMLWGPDVPRGARVSEPVSLRNIAATVADLIGIDDGPLGGRSLARHWSSTAESARDTVVTEMGYRRAVIVGRYHFIQAGGDEEPELYDIVIDPEERHNLFGSPLADSVLPPLMDILAGFPSEPGGGAETATGRS